jgi:hypothetical protein
VKMIALRSATIAKAKSVVLEKIAITTEHSISKILLIESLDYNLLSVS